MSSAQDMSNGVAEACQASSQASGSASGTALRSGVSKLLGGKDGATKERDLTVTCCAETGRLCVTTASGTGGRGLGFMDRTPNVIVNCSADCDGNSPVRSAASNLHYHHSHHYHQQNTSAGDSVTTAMPSSCLSTLAEASGGTVVSSNYNANASFCDGRRSPASASDRVSPSRNTYCAVGSRGAASADFSDSMTSNSCEGGSGRSHAFVSCTRHPCSGTACFSSPGVGGDSTPSPSHSLATAATSYNGNLEGGSCSSRSDPVRSRGNSPSPPDPKRQRTMLEKTCAIWEGFEPLKPARQLTVSE